MEIKGGLKKHRENKEYRATGRPLRTTQRCKSDSLKNSEIK